MTDLPAFGGEDPDDTHGVWSWDAGRMIVGSCPSDFEIVSRNEDDADDEDDARVAE